MSTQFLEGAVVGLVVLGCDLLILALGFHCWHSISYSEAVAKATMT